MTTDISHLKPGARWSSTNGKQFCIMSVVEVDGHTWVHYREDCPVQEECREFSCYAESFVERFTPNVNQ